MIPFGSLPSLLVPSWTYRAPWWPTVESPSWVISIEFRDYECFVRGNPTFDLYIQMWSWDRTRRDNALLQWLLDWIDGRMGGWRDPTTKWKVTNHSAVLQRQRFLSPRLIKSMGVLQMGGIGAPPLKPPNQSSDLSQAPCGPSVIVIHRPTEPFFIFITNQTSCIAILYSVHYEYLHLIPLVPQYHSILLGFTSTHPKRTHSPRILLSLLR